MLPISGSLRTYHPWAETNPVNGKLPIFNTSKIDFH